MSRIELIPKTQQKKLKELQRISRIVSDFDFSALVDVLCAKEDFEEDVANEAIIELSRFLTIKALDLDLDATKLSPSGLVDVAWHCFLLTQPLYNQFCDKILPSRVVHPNRVIGHNPLGAEDEDRDNRYTHTLQRYKEVFGIEPPSFYWDDDEEESGDEDEDEDEDDDDDAVEEEEGTDGNVRKRACLDESGEQVRSHACPLPSCNCEKEPRPALTELVEGVTDAIFVKTLTGKTLTIYVDLSTTTVGQLKAQIHIKEGIPCDQILLIFAGQRLKDDRLLLHYDIQNGYTVHLVLEPLRLVESDIQHSHHACPKPSCNCKCDPQGVWELNTGYIKGVTEQIFVKGVEGKTLTYNVDLSKDTAKELKAQIHAREGIPCGPQRLIFAGKQLDDDGRTLCI